MNQFLNKDDDKWHITMFVDIPRIVIRNHLNFRIYSVTSPGGVVTKDPPILNSNYVFHITPNLLGKKVFFNVSLSKPSIANVDIFKFGLCDENIGWHHATFFDVKNEYKGITIVSVEQPKSLPIRVEPILVVAEVPLINESVPEQELEQKVMEESVLSEDVVEVAVIPEPQLETPAVVKKGYQSKSKRK